MAYCRFSEDSDVYMYWHVAGAIECCACKYTPVYEEGKGPVINVYEGKEIRAVWKEEFPEFETFDDAIAHLEKHRADGHLVPDRAFERLRKDKEEYGNSAFVPRLMDWLSLKFDRE